MVVIQLLVTKKSSDVYLVIVGTSVMGVCSITATKMTQDPMELIQRTQIYREKKIEQCRIVSSIFRMIFKIKFLTF